MSLKKKIKTQHFPQAHPVLIGNKWQNLLDEQCNCWIVGPPVVFTDVLGTACFFLGHKHWWSLPTGCYGRPQKQNYFKNSSKIESHQSKHVTESLLGPWTIFQKWVGIIKSKTEHHNTKPGSPCGVFMISSVCIWKEALRLSSWKGTLYYVNWSGHKTHDPN